MSESEFISSLENLGLSISDEQINNMLVNFFLIMNILI